MRLFQLMFILSSIIFINSTASEQADSLEDDTYAIIDIEQPLANLLLESRKSYKTEQIDCAFNHLCDALENKRADVSYDVMLESLDQAGCAVQQSPDLPESACNKYLSQLFMLKSMLQEQNDHNANDEQSALESGITRRRRKKKCCRPKCLIRICQGPQGPQGGQGTPGTPGATGATGATGPCCTGATGPGNLVLPPECCPALGVAWGHFFVTGPYNGPYTVINFTGCGFSAESFTGFSAYNADIPYIRINFTPQFNSTPSITSNFILPVAGAAGYQAEVFVFNLSNTGAVLSFPPNPYQGSGMTIQALGCAG